MVIWAHTYGTQDLVSLDEVTVTGERIPLKFKQDTIEYDAKAFKVEA